jgi:hypothetical protein
VKVATPPDDEVTVYGFLVHRPPDLLHMCFVKMPFRRDGIAHDLFAGVQVEGATCTEWTKDFSDWIRERFQAGFRRDKYGRKHPVYKLNYNPFFSEAA